MEDFRPSITALGVARRRAAHQLFDDPKVFDDPLALRIIGETEAAELYAGTGRMEGSPLSPFLRAFFAVRSRYAEDQLALGVERGVRQYVVLGAGLDTFAYRNPHPATALRIFEVDHPATQAWKRTQLDQAGIAIPSSLTFAPVDFERQSLADGLRSAGYRADEPSFFSWLGVVPYLTREAVMNTLGFIASVGGGVVFDYSVEPASLSMMQRAVFEFMAARVARAGEPWRTFFDPTALTSELKAMGFSTMEDLGGDEINRRYFQDRRDGLRVGSIGRLMYAGSGAVNGKR
jgi:methyltransferase (TIGR00027 family)